MRKTLLFILLCIKLSAYSQTDSTKIYQYVDIMPEFPGGQEGLSNFIGQTLIYPDSAVKNDLEGKVFVKFVVNEDGNVSEVSVSKGAHPILDAEAVRVVELLPQFKPGLQDGKPVKVYYILPISFRFSDPKPSEKK